MTHSYMRHDSLTCVNNEWLRHSLTCVRNGWLIWCIHRLICLDDMCSLIWLIVWLIDMCDMTHWYVRHDSLICATWLIDMCDMTHWYVRHDSLYDSLICATWLAHVCTQWLIDMTHEIHMLIFLIHMCLLIWLTVWLIHICRMTHSHAHALIDWYDSFKCCYVSFTYV